MVTPLGRGSPGSLCGLPMVARPLLLPSHPRDLSPAPPGSPKPSPPPRCCAHSLTPSILQLPPNLRPGPSPPAAAYTAPPNAPPSPPSPCHVTRFSISFSCCFIILPCAVTGAKLSFLSQNHLRVHGTFPSPVGFSLQRAQRPFSCRFRKGTKISHHGQVVYVIDILLKFQKHLEIKKIKIKEQVYHHQ